MAGEGGGEGREEGMWQGREGGEGGRGTVRKECEKGLRS